MTSNTATVVHGWPETWYAWRLVMPALARDFQVIAVDQRGIGLSDKRQAAYPRLSYFNEVDNGGYFAAREEPKVFTLELRAAFRSLR
jgi:hypothetical protein